MNCTDKTPYPSQHKAEEYAKKRMRENRTLVLRAYWCPDCGLWHLTHLPESQERAS